MRQRLHLLPFYCLALHQSCSHSLIKITHNRWSGVLLAVTMKTRALLQRLLDAERALQSGDCPAAQNFLLQAQETVLQIDRELIDMQARLSASAAPFYRSVAVEITNRRAFRWQPKSGTLRFRVGRLAVLIFDIGSAKQHSPPPQ